MLLHYRVVQILGRGGMGEVYRAHDTTLGRDVAIKVLPESVAGDADRLKRFDREARTLATLNHPNIAAIHGVVDVDNTRGLVLELIEGESLSGRLQRGPLGVDQTIRIARDVASALEAAHEKGIVHRDLKPANISITAQGVVKVLDFGLAKFVHTDGAESSPTITDAGTRQGAVLGTAAYMSPEQARGQEVGRQTDIWAFGCVLFEMLTGGVAFGGATWADTIKAVLDRDPDWSAMPAAVPAPLRRLAQRCLERDLSRRFRDIGDVRILLEELAQSSTDAVDSAPARARRTFALAAAALIFGLALVATWMALERKAPADAVQPTARAVVTVPPDAPLAIGRTIGTGFNSPLLAISPSGSHLAYVGMYKGVSKVFLRPIAGDEFVALEGTDGAVYAFFAPDGRAVGFLTRDKVRRVSLAGGAPITVADAREPREAWWLAGGVIYFTTDQGGILLRVSSDGRGRPEEIVGLPVRRTIDAWGLFVSDVLPDGKTALLTKRSTGILHDYADVMALSLETFEARTLIRSGYGARYVEPGYLLFARAAQLLSVPVNAQTLQPLADPSVVETGVATESFFGVVHMAATKDVIVAVPGADRSHGSFAWVDRRGRSEPLGMPPQSYGAFDLSPDGRRVAVHVGDVTDYIWIFDLNRREGRRLAWKSSAGWPVWHPDGSALLFRSIHGRVSNTYVIRSVDSEAPSREVMSPRAITTVAWAPDGKTFAVRFQNLLGYETADRTRIGKTVDGVFPTFSADGRWLAYAASDTVRPEVWVMSHPDGSGRRQITTDGGTEPIWCGCGELFYRSGNSRWFSVKTVTSGDDISWTPAQLAFETEIVDTPGISYDVSPDGQRLLVIKRADADVRDRINLSLNWRARLESGERN